MLNAKTLKYRGATNVSTKTLTIQNSGTINLSELFEGIPVQHVILTVKPKTSPLSFSIKYYSDNNSTDPYHIESFQLYNDETLTITLKSVYNTQLDIIGDCDITVRYFRLAI